MNFKLDKTSYVYNIAIKLFYYLAKIEFTKTELVENGEISLFYCLAKFKLTKTSNSFLPKKKEFFPSFFYTEKYFLKEKSIDFYRKIFIFFDN